MMADSSVGKKKLCSMVILDANVMSLKLNKLNVTGGSSTLYYDVWFWLNVGLLLANRLILRRNIKPTQVQCLVFAGSSL